MQQVISAKKTISEDTQHWYRTFITWCMACGGWSFESRMSEADVKAECAASDWYAPLGGVYNSRCSTADTLTTPNGACGPVASTSYLKADEFMHSAHKARLYADPGNDLSTPRISACTAWPVQYFLCDGRPCFDDDALTEELIDQIAKNETVVYGIHPKYFYECMNLFLRHELYHELQAPDFSCHDPANTKKRRKCTQIAKAERSVWRGEDGTLDMDFSITYVWAKGLKNGKNWAKLIRSLRRKLNDFEGRTDIKVYPHGSLWVYNYQFVFLEDVTAAAFGYAALAVFLITCLFFVMGQHSTKPKRTRIAEAIRLAGLITVGVGMQMVLFVALMGLTDLNLNIFTLATVIVSFGIGIESVAHTSFGYLAASGEPQQRAVKAIEQCFMPITDGAFTTFLGFAPLVASQYQYVVLYYFLIYVILIVIAFMFGVVVFPALLSAFGRTSDVADCAFADQTLLTYETTSSPVTVLDKDDDATNEED